MTASPAQDPFDAPDEPGYSRVPRFLWNYAYDQSDLALAAVDLRRYMAELAVEASIPVHTIEARAKRLDSYRDKALKKLPDGSPKYDDPAAFIRDCIAARVILFTTRGRNDFADIIASRTAVHERQNPGDVKHNGYDSEHFIVTNIDPDARARYSALARFLDKYPGMEIQLRSVAAHAWAEYEHDIRYKSGTYEALTNDGKLQIDQWFIEAGGMRRYMDDLFDKIQDLLQPQSGDTEPPVDPSVLDEEYAEDDDIVQDTAALDSSSLAAFIALQFPHNEVGELPALTELLEHLRLLGIATHARLESALLEVEADQVAKLMDYPITPTGLRLVDDELLAVFTDSYVSTAPDDGRRRLLQLRLRRVRGKFAIYSIFDGNRHGRAVAAARAVRDLTALVANQFGLEAAVLEGSISLQREKLLPSTHPRAVRTQNGPIFVATNLTRTDAESMMRRLVGRAPGSGFSVTRAGDVLCCAPED